MRDTTKRDAVMVEFSEIASPFGSEREERMADEIVRLRHRAERAERILSAVRAAVAVAEREADA